MAQGSRLDELTARYMQNPRRYFVPLANEYRKARELDRAIALCREHLPSQPGHMSGHVVLARAYFDKGDLLAAREVFAISVQLDDENMIALRHLGDIAHARSEVAEARVWYSRVLGADPQNREIVALLASLDAPAADSTVQVSPRDDLGISVSDDFERVAPAAPLSEPAAAAAHPFETVDLATLFGVDREMEPVELPGSPSAMQWPEEDAQAAASIDTADAPAAADAPGSVVAPGTSGGFGFSFEDLDAYAEPRILAPTADEDLSSGADVNLPDDTFAYGLIATSDMPSAGEPTADMPTAGEPTADLPAPGEPTADLPTAGEPTAGEPTAAVPAADDSLVPLGFSALASFASWRTALARNTPSMLPVQPTPARVAPIVATDLAPIVRLAFVDEPDLVELETPMDAGAPVQEFMTETMAVLYAQQGYTQQALDIYLALQHRAPNDAAIAGKIAELNRTLQNSASQDALEADADKALQYDELDNADSLEFDRQASSANEVPLIADETLDAAFASAWSAAPAADDAGDDWFADDGAIGSNADLFTESDDLFGITLGGFNTPDAARDADMSATAALDPIPVDMLAVVFGGAEIDPSDAMAADFLSSLAAQMVGRLPTETPTLPVPELLELPASSAVDPASGTTPAPLLTFDRFFSGSGPAPRARVETPIAANRLSTPPAHVWPSLSPAVGGVPEVEPSDSADAASSAMHRPDAPAAPTLEPPAASAMHRLDAPAAPALEPPAASAEPEPSRAPSSDFHRWLEGLS